MNLESRLQKLEQTGSEVVKLPPILMATFEDDDIIFDDDVEVWNKDVQDFVIMKSGRYNYSDLKEHLEDYTLPTIIFGSEREIHSIRGES